MGGPNIPSDVTDSTTEGSGSQPSHNLKFIKKMELEKLDVVNVQPRINVDQKKMEDIHKKQCAIIRNSHACYHAIEETLSTQCGWRTRCKSSYGLCEGRNNIVRHHLDGYISARALISTKGLTDGLPVIHVWKMSFKNVMQY